MPLISLTLTGFKGIRAGLGRESITINFREITGNAQLVAIAGGNGRGKTTILDNMTLYPVMPSQAGKDGLGAFSYYDEVYLPVSEKIVIQEQDGLVYRAHMVFHLSARRRTEAYLHVQHFDGWKPVQLPDGTVSDGKMESFVRCVEYVAGPQTVFLTTCFSAQNRRQLSKYANGEIKALFSELLGLDDIRTQGERAAMTVRLVRAGLVTLRQQRQYRQVEAQALAAEHAATAQCVAATNRARAMLDTASEDLAQSNTRLARIEAQARADEQYRNRRNDLLGERDRLNDHYHAAVSSIENRHRTLALRRNALRQSVQQRAEERRLALRALRQQQDSLIRTLSARDRVDRAVATLPRRHRLVQLFQARVSVQRHSADRAHQLDTEIAHVRASVAATEREAGKAVLHADGLRRRFGLTTTVPCAGMDLQRRCQLLGDAHAAQRLVPSAEADVQRLGSTRQLLIDKVAMLEQERADLGPAAAILRNTIENLQRAEQRLRETASLAARRDDVSTAADNLAIVERQIAALEEQIPRQASEDDADERAIADEVDTIRLERKGVNERHEAALAYLDSALSELPPPFDPRRWDLARQDVANAETAVAQAEQAYSDTVAAQQRHVDTGERLLALRNNIAALDTELERIEVQCATWTLLSKALSADGVVALSIEDAGPELSALTNELLMACYGPRFTVSLQTQVASAKGEMGDGFAIVVHDADSGESTNLVKMSGGERVWIHECLARAMALHLARSARARSDTLFSDEADGAFDPEHKRQFMAAKRAVLALGNYCQEFYISHTPELVEMADVVIDLDKFRKAPLHTGGRSSTVHISR